MNIIFMITAGFCGMIVGFAIVLVYPHIILSKKTGFKLIPKADYEKLHQQNSEKEQTINTLVLDIASHQRELQKMKTKIIKSEAEKQLYEQKIKSQQTRISTLEKQIEHQKKTQQQVHSENAVTPISPQPDQKQEAQKARFEGSKPKPATPKPLLSKPVWQLEDDNLQLITGIGVVIQDKLNQEGIRTFRDLSELDEQKIKYLQQRTRIFSSKLRQWSQEAQEILQKK